ncbi:hypothetical protein FACS189432_08150 [Bacteroidia bacterium]|nr:hypothetical protein FACS189432_08150 [Bacteroidia bacterium]
MLLVVILCAYVLMRPFRPMPKMPLYGVDWLGLVLWSTFILSLIFVVQYGNQLNWLDSAYIRVGATLGKTDERHSKAPNSRANPAIKQSNTSKGVE